MTRLTLATMIALCLALPAAAEKAHFFEEGLASWYGGKFHGRQTASGERYDKNGISAAHKTLPFGTVVLVTNLDNGKKMRVRINDRGPFVKGRVIDLSEGAAKVLGVHTAGIAKVRLELVGRVPDAKDSRLSKKQRKKGAATPATGKKAGKKKSKLKELVDKDLDDDGDDEEALDAVKKDIGRAIDTSYDSPPTLPRR